MKEHKKLSWKLTSFNFLKVHHSEKQRSDRSLEIGKNLDLGHKFFLKTELWLYFIRNKGCFTATYEKKVFLQLFPQKTYL